MDVDGVGAAGGGQGRAWIQVALQRDRIKGGGHDADQKIGTAGGLQFHGTRQSEVAVEVAFMKFVEQDGGDFGEIGVADQLPQQNAFGFVFDPRRVAGNVLEADLIADLVAERDAAFVGDTGRQQAGGQAARLQDHHFAARNMTVIQQHLGDLRRFSGSGGCLNDQTPVLTAGVVEIGANRFYREVCRRHERTDCID